MTTDRNVHRFLFLVVAATLLITLKSVYDRRISNNLSQQVLPSKEDPSQPRTICMEAIEREDGSITGGTCATYESMSQYVEYMMSKLSEEEKQSDFELWLADKGRDTELLQEQIVLAKELYEEAKGWPDAEISEKDMIKLAKKMIKTIQKAEIRVGHLIRYEGISVDWLLSVLFEIPYMRQLKEFGCQLWFIRRVAIIELLRRQNILSGAFIDHVGEVYTTSEEVLLSLDLPIVANATVFLSYTGRISLNHLIEVLGQLRGEYIWMDVFCVDQFAWTGKSRSEDMKVFRTQLVSGLQEQIKAIDKTVLVLEKWDDAMLTLGQIWVLWEIFNTIEGNASFEILLPNTEGDSFLFDALSGGDKYSMYWKSLAAIDATSAVAESDVDREVILGLMREKGLDNVNQQVIAQIKEWAIETGRASVRQNKEDQDDPNLFLLNNFAILLKDHGMPQEAESLNREVLADRSKFVGQKCYDTYDSLYNLGISLLDQGKLSEAESFLHQAWASRQELLGENHIRTISSIHMIASLRYEQGRHMEAHKLITKAVNARRLQLGDEHSETLESYHMLADVVYAQHNLGMAEELFRKVRSGRQKVLGVFHPHTLRSTIRLADVLKDLRQFGEAADLYREALKGNLRMHGTNHETLEIMHKLAVSLSMDSKFSEAVPMFYQILELNRRSLGADHENVRHYLHVVGDFLAGQNRYQEAEPFFVEALATNRRVRGNEHPDTIKTLNLLGILYQTTAEFAKAESLFLELLHTFRKLNGDLHVNTLLSLRNLAVALQPQGKAKESLALMHEACTGLLKTRGQHDPHTIECLRSQENVKRNVVSSYRPWK